MLAGELHNSSASGVEHMRRVWPHLEALGLNTVLAPVSWELLEPAEGEFDFTYVDTLVDLEPIRELWDDPGSCPVQSGSRIGC